MLPLSYLCCHHRIFGLPLLFISSLSIFSPMYVWSDDICLLCKILQEFFKSANKVLSGTGGPPRGVFGKFFHQLFPYLFYNHWLLLTIHQAMFIGKSLTQYFARFLFSTKYTLDLPPSPPHLPRTHLSSKQSFTAKRRCYISFSNCTIYQEPHSFHNKTISVTNIQISGQ